MTKRPPAKKPKSEEPGPPEFVRKATAAERKAALERLAAEAALPVARAPPPVAPRPAPEAVKRANAAERKAAVEAIATNQMGQYLGRVPLPSWKKPKTEAPSAEAPKRPPEPKVGAKPTRLPPAEREARPTGGTSPKRVVILDTNALMMQFQFHVNIEGELRRILDFAYEIVVPDAVLHELTDLAHEASGKDAQEARMALEFAKHFKTMEAPAEGDAGILRLAEKLDAIVVTNDKLLRARLRAKNIPNVHLRSRAFLTLEGHVTGV